MEGSGVVVRALVQYSVSSFINILYYYFKLKNHLHFLVRSTGGCQ